MEKSNKYIYILYIYICILQYLCTVIPFLGRTSFCPAHCGTSNLSQTKESAIPRTRRLYFKWLADWQLQKWSLSNLAGNVNHTSKISPSLNHWCGCQKLCIYIILFIIKSYLHPYDIPYLQTSQRYSIWLWIMYPLSRAPFWCHGAVFSASPLLMQRMQSFVHGLDVRGASATGGKKANVGSRHLMLIYINITRLYIPSLKLT